MRLGGAFILIAALASAAAPAWSAADEAPPGATACSGCHGAAKAVPPIAGRDPAEITAAMEEFRTGKRPATVMDRVAKGFKPEEVQAIASWWAAQK